jgi:hypothetical protein|tara:strand:+ start:556 stop:810 length:255 start_codon:yes stop_codon:yes gene_type:complete
MSKITEKQLETLKESQGKINQVVNTVGVLTIQKINIDNQKDAQLEELKKLEESQLELRKELEEQYGKISVNLEDGSYEEIPDKE